MTRRSLFLLASLTVLLGGRGAYAERLGGAYRGPEDLTKAEKDSGATTDTGGTGSSSGGSEKSSGGGSESGGTGAGGDSGGGSGAPEGGGGGGSEGGGSEGGGSSGPDAGGGGDTSGGKSTGGSSGSSGGDTGGSSGGGAGGGPGKKGANQDQFYVASWFFEQNREQLIAHYNESVGRPFKIPTRSSATVFGVLPRDLRQRWEITSEDKDKIFDILKKHVELSNDAVVRDAAVVALGKLGTQPAVDLLKVRLGQEHDLQVKQDILVALGASRSPAAVPVLIEAIRGDKGGKVTSFALIGLGLSGDADRPKAAGAVLDYFTANVKKSGNEDALCSAAVALGVLQHADAAKPLAQALNNKSVADVIRCYCAQALGKIKGDVAQKALEEALAKGGQEVERAAAIALGGFGEASVARVLAGKEGMGKADPLSAGLAAVSLGRVLGQIDEDEWKGAPEDLRSVAMNTAKSAVKSQYANLALTFFGGFDKEVRKFYATSLSETKVDKDVQSALAMAAGLGGVNSVQSALLGVAKDGGRDKNTRAYAAIAFGMVGQSRATETAKSLREVYSSSDDPMVRRGAILGLGFVGDRKDVPFLLSVIEQTKEDLAIARYTRGAAVIALGMIRDGESIGRIHQLTERSDLRTRAYALAALGYLADKDEVPVMSQLFDNTNFRQKCATVEALMHQL